MWLVAVNPNAGSGRALALSRQVTDFLSAHGESFRTLIAPNASELSLRLKEVVGEHSSAIKAIVAVGGDGLVHLVLQFSTPEGIPFAVIPAGTGNDFCRTLGWSTSEIKVLLQKMITTPPQAIDLGNVDSEWFGAILSTGFDSVVNERANALSWPKGAARYNAAIALELPRFKAINYELIIDGVRVSTEAMLIAVGNGRSYGAGMNICPQAQINDGLFDLVILEPVSKVEFIKVFPRVYSGSHISHPQVKTFRAAKVQISGPTIAYADGERIGPAPVSAECIAGAGLTWIR
jgi:diacylglycerol kinase (ATP)